MSASRVVRITSGRPSIFMRRQGLLPSPPAATTERRIPSVMMDKQGEVWLVDFDRAEAAASRAPLDRDAATLLAVPDGVADPALARAPAEQASAPTRWPACSPGWGHAGHPRPRGPGILTGQERYPSQPHRQSAILGSATDYCSSGTKPDPGHRWPCGCRRLSRGNQMGGCHFLFVQFRWPAPPLARRPARASRPHDRGRHQRPGPTWPRWPSRPPPHRPHPTGCVPPDTPGRPHYR
jgi:hypothetical protein